MNQRQRLLEQIRQQSIQKRAQALREAAQKQANNAPIAAAAGASSGGGGRSGCYPPGGVLLRARIEPEPGFFLYQNFFLAQSGSRNGRPSYEWPAVFNEAGLTDKILLIISWNGSLWELIDAQETPEGDQFIIGATSPELYGVWNPTGVEPVLLETVPGAELQCQYRYCASITGFDGDTSVFSPFMVPIWFGVPLDGPPNSYLTAFGETPTLIWIDELQQWVINDGLDVLELGGTRDSLPTGTFEIGDGATMTISTGFCDPAQNPNV